MKELGDIQIEISKKYVNEVLRGGFENLVENAEREAKYILQFGINGVIYTGQFTEFSQEAKSYLVSLKEKLQDIVSSLSTLSLYVKVLKGELRSLYLTGKRGRFKPILGIQDIMRISGALEVLVERTEQLSEIVSRIESEEELELKSLTGNLLSLINKAKLVAERYTSLLGQLIKELNEKCDCKAEI